MLKLAVFLLLILEPLLSLARPQYYCAIPCPLTKPCDSGCYNSFRKYPINTKYSYDDESYSCPCPINLTVNCCSEGDPDNKPQTATPPPPAPPNPPPPNPGSPPPPPRPPPSPPPPPPPPPPPQSRSGEDGSNNRRSGGGRSNMLTSLFSIPGAVADTFLSGEVTL